ncbi:hypothetical protein MMC06_006303 [Schaereria dolodes]|nr:hypothetical protein [Schaereria dolodes]
MADSTPKSYHTDPTLYLYTSLTAGSSHIITATSRLETILKANKIPFQALDVATDEKARMLWGRRAGKKKLPGLVRMGMIVGDLEEIEEWNEYGELKANVGGDQPAPATPSPSTTNTPSKPPTTSTASNPSPLVNSPANPSPYKSTESPLTAAMRQAGQEAAQKASASKAKPSTAPSKPSAVELETLSKLDNSGPTGMPPPSGTTDAESAKLPETGGSGAVSKADDVPEISEQAARSTTSLLPERGHGVGGGPGGTFTKHRGSTVSLASPEEIKDVESKQAIQEEDEDGDEDEDGNEESVEEERVEGEKGVKTEDATASTDKAQDLPGKKTQEQAAASADGIEESVAD